MRHAVFATTVALAALLAGAVRADVETLVSTVPGTWNAPMGQFDGDNRLLAGDIAVFEEEDGALRFLFDQVDDGGVIGAEMWGCYLSGIEASGRMYEGNYDCGGEALDHVDRSQREGRFALHLPDRDPSEPRTLLLELGFTTLYLLEAKR